jgi:hypothetical protein
MNVIAQFKAENWSGFLVVIRDVVQSSWRFDDKEV